MSAENVVKDFLHVLRNQFYPDNPKAFFQQRSMLIKAITYPAAWLEDKGVRIPEARYREILTGIIRGIQHHGDTAKIKYFCRYFLHCVQLHMRHHGPDYYEEGKTLRTILDQAMTHLSMKQRDQLPAAQDNTTAALAALSRLVRPPRRHSRKKPDSPQLDLL